MNGASSFDEFTTLQDALHQLNYSQPLTRDNVPLVQAILSDLTVITNKYAQLRKESEHAQKRMSAELEHARAERDKLAQQQNDLHSRVIESANEHDADVRRLQSEGEQLRLEKNEMSVLLNSKKHKIRSQELMINNLRKKLNAVLMSSNASAHSELLHKTGKILSPELSENNHNHNHNDIDDEKFVLLQRENESLLSETQELRRLCDEYKSKMASLENAHLQWQKLKQKQESNSECNGERIENKQAASQNIAYLSSQIEVLQTELSEKETEVERYKLTHDALEKLRTENSELAENLESATNELGTVRADLASMTESQNALLTERKYDGLKSAHKLQKHAQSIPGMVRELEQLTKVKKTLESRLATKCKQHSILSEKQKQHRSEQELWTKTLETKQRALDTLQREQKELRQVCEELKQKLQETQNEVGTGVFSRNELEQRLQTATQKLGVVEQENAEFVENMERIKNELGRSRSFCKELETKNESFVLRMQNLEREKRALLEQISSVTSESETMKHSENAKQSENFALIQQLQKLQFETEDLQNTKTSAERLLCENEQKIRKLEQEKHVLGTSLEQLTQRLTETNTQNSDLECKFEFQKSEMDNLREKIRKLETMIASLKTLETECATHTQKQNQLELDAVHLKNECGKFSKLNENLQQSNARKQTTITKLEGDKTQLRQILSQMQQRMSAFGQRLTQVTADRDDLHRLYDASMTELNTKNDAIETLQSNINQFKTERVTFQERAENFEKEVLALRAQCSEKDGVCREASHKMQSLAQLQANANQSVAQQLDENARLRDTVQNVVRERDECRAQIEQLTQQCTQFKETIVPRMSQELLLSQATNEELKALCTKLDDGHKNAQSKIEELFQRNQQLMDAVRDQQTTQQTLTQQMQQGEADKNGVHSALQNLVSEHDRVQNELDQKCETIAALQQTLQNAKHENERFQTMLSELQQKFNAQQKNLVQVSEELVRQRQQLHQLQNQVIPRLQEENALKTQQIKNGVQDLNNATKENQFLNEEYMQTMHDRDTKNDQLSTALNKILFLESAQNNLGTEKTQILENYKSVVLENEKLQSLTQVLERTKSECSVKLCTLEQHVASRDARIQELERALSACNVSNHELQRQIQMVTRDLQRTNLNSTKHETMSHNLQKDLQSMQRDVVRKQMTDLDKKNGIIVQFKRENKKLQTVIHELSMEKEVALNSLQTAETKMHKLEEIIKHLRVDHISNTEVSMREKDESGKLHRELNQMKDLNHRLNTQLHRLQSTSQLSLRNNEE
mmetsp:Transcript_27364/g.44969  ORF Transcript_27364/g.44969 Transcript_27364/m.44969 type:complete len:1274 (+) Transcript_27364:43-3864(+)